MKKVNLSNYREYLKPAVLIVGWIFILILFSFYPVAGLRVGDKSLTTYTSPRTAFYIDQARTEELKKMAENMVLPVLTIDQAKTLEMLSNLNANLELISQVRNQDISFEEKKELLLKYIPTLSDKDFDYLLKLPEGAFKALSLTTHLLIKQVLETGVKEEALNDIGVIVRTSAIQKEIPSEETDIITKLAVFIIKDPNMFENPEATEKRRKEAREAVFEVKNIIYRGETILRAGETITNQHLEMLQAVGLTKKPRGFLDSPYIFLLYLILLGGGYYKFSKKELFSQSKKLNDWILISLSLFVLFVCYLLKQLPFEYQVVPILVVAVIIAVATDYFDGFLFLLANFGVLLLINPISGVELGLVLVGLSSGLIFLGRSRHRVDLIFLAITTFAIVFFLYFPYRLYEGFDPLNSVKSSFAIAISAGGAYLVAMVLLPFLERYFNLLSPYRLLELADSDQLLLKTLLMEAPGTYHHSQIVATLSEHAASKIKADALLCKVGALYHDLGKITHPLFYSENQFSGDSIHNKISPALSAKVITAHPQEGLEVGRKAKLPPQILNIIASHHGTFLASYFYSEATLRETEPKEEAYRYPGPKPTTKEATIIMFADACEATIRSISEINAVKVKEVVDMLIKERMEDNQLEESPLSSQELKIVKEALVDNLLTLYHSRLDYGQYNP